MGIRKSQEKIFEVLRYNNKYRKFVVQKQILDCTYLTFKPRPHIRKVSKSQYIKVKYVEINAKEEIVSDGEVHEMGKDKDGRNKRSLRKIYKDLRQKINANFANPYRKTPYGNITNQLFITLTFDPKKFTDETDALTGKAKPMTDTKILYREFMNFWKRLKRRFREHQLEYICINEPHASGQWHIHLLLKSVNGFLQADNMTKDVISNTWRNGIVDVRELNSVDNIGAYFIAYFTNVELDPDQTEKYAAENDVKYVDGKARIKGERIKFYKDWFKIYTTSAGIEEPETTTDEEVIDEFPVSTYRHIKEIEVPAEKIENVRNLTIATEQRQKE